MYMIFLQMLRSAGFFRRALSVLRTRSHARARPALAIGGAISSEVVSQLQETILIMYRTATGPKT
jgi:hypothetical protein